MEIERSQKNQIKFEKNKARRLYCLIFKTSYKAPVIKSVQYCRGIDTDQWDRIDGPEIDPHIHGQLIFDKGAKAIQWRKDGVFNKL